jgi:hypothetical protein
VDDPRLGLERGVLIDGQGAGAHDLLDDIHAEVEALEPRCQVEAERRLADAV